MKKCPPHIPKWNGETIYKDQTRTHFICESCGLKLVSKGWDVSCSHEPMSPTNWECKFCNERVVPSGWKVER